MRGGEKGWCPLAILNYTTKVSPEKTVAEIVLLLQRKGVLSINHLFEGGKLIGLGFVLPVGGKPVDFRLPANVEGVKQCILRNRRGQLTKLQRKQVEEQAPRTAWRILKDWIEAQIALVESNQAEMGQVFLPYALGRGAEGREQTMYQLFVENNQKQLTAGGA